MESTIRRPAAVTTAQTTRLGATLLSGVGASILGGIALAIVLIVAFMTVEKTSLFYALRPVGTFLYGDRMLVQPTPAMYAAALALHLGVCVAWGIVYAAAASLLRVEASVPGALLLGVVIGLTALILDVHALVPQLEQARWGRDLFGAVTPPLFSFLGHIAFGLCFAVAPLLYRRLVRPTGKMSGVTPPERGRLVGRAARRMIGPALLVALVVLLFAPLALGRSFWLRDAMEFTYPLKGYLLERMHAGELALWNPRLGLGRPFAGVVQPGVFYPLDVVLLIGRYPRSVDLFFALHAVIAALGMRAWLRARLAGDGANRELAATFGGALYALSGYLVSELVGSGTYAVGAAWLPWALSAPLSPVRVAVPMALMVLGGDPEAAWFAGALVLVEAAVHPERKRAFVAAAGGLGLAVALAAVQLGPALEVARVGRPGGVPLADASHFSFPPLRLFELAWPDVFGPRYGADWLVHPLYDEGTGQAYQPWAAGIYVGLATPLLALAALLGARDPSRRRNRALAAVALVALLVAFGSHTPLWAAWFRFVPGARLFRYPEKYLLVVTLCATALAAIGLPRALAQPRRALFAGTFFLGMLGARALFARLAGGAFFAARLGRLEHGSVAELGGVVTSSAVHALVIAVASLLPLVLAARGRLAPRAATLALAAVVVVDLFAQSITLTDYVPSALYQETPPPVAAARALAGPGLLRIYRPLLNQFPSSLPVPVALRATLRPDCGVEDGVATLDAYDNFPVAHEEALWAALRRQPLRLLAVTATRFALLPPGLFAAHDTFVERARWPALGALLAEATASPPRVYLATGTRVAADDEAATLLGARDFQPGRSVVLAPGDGARELASDGSCTLAPADDRTERLTIHCHATAASYAVVADAWFPGWYATVGGAPAPILRANLAMRAVPVPAGDSTVELAYRPAHLRAGAVVSLLALLLCVGLTVRANRRRA